MADEKKGVNTEKLAQQELDLDDLEQVTGGSISNVKHTKTKSISKNTKSKA